MAVQERIIVNARRDKLTDNERLTPMASGLVMLGAGAALAELPLAALLATTTSGCCCCCCCSCSTAASSLSKPNVCETSCQYRPTASFSSHTYVRDFFLFMFSFVHFFFYLFIFFRFLARIGDGAKKKIYVYLDSYIEY